MTWLRLVAVLFCLTTFTSCAWADDMPFSKSMDLDGDGSPEQIRLIFSDKDEIGNCRASLKVVSKNKSFDKYLGDWFLPDLTGLDVLTIGQNIKPFIVVDSAGGAHSETRIVFLFDGLNVKQVLKVSSDAPSIEEKDQDGDGILEMIAKQRDYDRDPTIDSREIVYKWDGTGFVEVK